MSRRYRTGARHGWWARLLKIVAAGAVLAAGAAPAAVRAASPSVITTPQKLAACLCTYFGASVAVSGTTAVVGEPGSNDRAGRAYVFSESAGSWSQTAELVGSDTVSADGFGSSVAIVGTTVVVSAPAHASYAGAAYVFSGSGSAWAQTGELAGADSASGDWFGGSVAIDGTTVIVGAPGHAGFSGSAYVFDDVGGSWAQTAELTGSSASDSYFGYSVALSGQTAVVGAPGNNITGTGRAYVFAKSTQTWAQTAELSGPTSNSNIDFGSSVGISGTIVVVGAWRSSKGAAYVFTESGGAWTRTAELQATDAAGGDDLGASVAMSGTTVVVGGVINIGNIGAAYVFAESSGTWSLTAELSPSGKTGGDFVTSRSVALSGTTIFEGAPGHGFPGGVYVFTDTGLGGWTEATQLKSSNTSNTAASDRFGTSVGIDGTNAVVGAPGHYGGAGQAYMLTVNKGAYEPTLALDAFGTVAGDEFGASVAISATTAVVGAPAHANAGRAYIFLQTTTGPYSMGTVRCTPGLPLNGGHCRAWSEAVKLTGSDTATGDDFGASVAISGTTVIVGAPGHVGGGSAYVFSESGSTWSQVAELTGSDSATGDAFGASVAISGTTLMAGAPGHVGGGSAYVFNESGSTWSQVAELAGSDTATGDAFGASVAISGATAIVGAPGHGGGGGAYLFNESGSTWPQVAELAGSDTATGDAFGASVAISGATAIVGAPGHSGGGSAYVFSNSGSTWPQTSVLVGSNTVTGDDFGASVTISGSVAVVGTPLYSTQAAADAGEGYAFNA